MSTSLTAPPRLSRLSRGLMAALLPALMVVLGACGYGSRAGNESPAATADAANGKKLSADQVRIGYFPNVTHATALVGLEKGWFAEELGGTRIKPQVFTAGPSEIEALNAGAIDIGWIGPSPAVNGYARADGKNLRIISGSASGGVCLVVNPRKVSGLAELRGKRVATPQLGNTQDVALLNYLAEHKLRVDPRTGKGQVTVIRQDSKEIPTSFQRGQLDGAWVPEPTASKLVASGGEVLLDEKELWKDGRFVTTNVIVSQRFLKDHPDVVEAVLRGSVRANAWITAHPDRARDQVNSALKKLTGKALPDNVIGPAFRSVEITDDPLASTLGEQAAHAVRAGLSDKADLTGIYDLTLLNRVLKAEGKPKVTDAGLGPS